MIVPDYVIPQQAWLPLYLNDKHQITTIFPSQTHKLGEKSQHILGFRSWKQKKDLPVQTGSIKIVGKINLWGRTVEYDKSYVSHKIALYPELQIEFDNKEKERNIALFLNAIFLTISFLLLSWIFTTGLLLISLLFLYTVFSRAYKINGKQQNVILKKLKQQGFVCNK